MEGCDSFKWTCDLPFFARPGQYHAGSVAMLFTFSMASTVVALFKYQVDLERPARLEGEGLVMLSVRAIRTMCMDHSI
jgi:hypothetical protein